jgi:hypothetical protein
VLLSILSNVSLKNGDFVEAFVNLFLGVVNKLGFACACKPGFI